jgi:hypothetical protein
MAVGDGAIVVFVPVGTGISTTSGPIRYHG